MNKKRNNNYNHLHKEYYDALGESQCVYEEEGISLKELLVVLFKGKKTIFLTTAIILVLVLLGSLIIPNVNLTSKGEVQTVIQLSFKGIEKGMTPDGTPYDVNEVKSPEILKNALDQVSFSKKIAVSDISSCISFQGVIPDDAAKTLQNISGLKTEQLKLDRLESLEIYPDTYLVTLNVVNGLGISIEEGRELLDHIASAYRTWLLKKYSNYKVLPNIFTEEYSLEEYDYIQAANLFDQQISEILNYIDFHFVKSDYYSATTGFSAAELKNAVTSLREIELERLYANISAFYISKDATKSVAIYEKMAEDLDREYAKRNEEAQSLKGIITNFNKNEAVVLGDLGQSVTLKVKSSQYDQLVNQYIRAGTLASEASADADYYRREAASFKNAEFISGPETEAAKEVENIIESIKSKVVHWTNVVNATALDYYRTLEYGKYSRLLIPAMNYEAGSNINLLLNMAIGVALGLILGVLIVLFREYLKEEDGQDAA